MVMSAYTNEELTTDGSENISLSALSTHEGDEASASSSASSTSSTSNLFAKVVNPLSIPLRILFTLNGVTMSMATIPVMYIINTRIAIPLAYVTSYWALVFLPCKPIYASISVRVSRRDYLLSFLLCACGLSYMSAIFLKKGPNDILWTFTMGFFQGTCTSFPEFLLGLSLLDQARNEQSRLKTTNTIMEGKTAAALYQAQAATARNFGSLTASIAVFFFLSSTNKDDKQLNDTVVNRLFLTIAFLNITASLFVCKFSIGLQSHHESFQTPRSGRAIYVPSNDAPIIQYQRNADYDSVGQVDGPQQEQFVNGDDTRRYCAASSTSNGQHFEDNTSGAGAGAGPETDADAVSVRGDKGKSNVWINTSLFIVLQLIIITFAVRGPVIDHIQPWIWNVLATSLMVSLVLIFVCWLVVIWQPRNSKQNSWWVGLFLVLRYIIPKPSSLVYSFFYILLQNKASIFQLISVLEMAALTASSWTFGKFFSTWSIKVVVGTTLLAMCVSLAYGKMIKFVLIHHEDDDDESSWEDGNLWFLFVYIAFRVADTFTMEWKFLPDVILATETAAKKVDIDDNETTISSEYAERDDESVNPNDNTAHEHESFEDEQIERDRSTRALSPTANTSNNAKLEEAVSASEMEYGMLISCIGFGDELGALLVGPLVTALDVQRENHWKNLNVIVELCAWLEIFPLLILIGSIFAVKHCKLFK